jgi:hypothetical protein
MVHVEPPFDLLASMVTVRVHLDAVPETNAPLLVAPGSHKRGRIPASKIPEVVRQCGIITCLAAAGDIWLYATPILHASDAASGTKGIRFTSCLPQPPFTPTERAILQLKRAARASVTGRTDPIA